MKLSKRERDFIITLVTAAQKILKASATIGRKKTPRKRIRRSSADVAQLKRQVNAARRSNVPVKEIADDLGVTPAYIYQLMR